MNFLFVLCIEFSYILDHLQGASKRCFWMRTFALWLGNTYEQFWSGVFLQDKCQMISFSSNHLTVSLMIRTPLDRLVFLIARCRLFLGSNGDSRNSFSLPVRIVSSFGGSVNEIKSWHGKKSNQTRPGRKTSPSHTNYSWRHTLIFW